MSATLVTSSARAHRIPTSLVARAIPLANLVIDGPAGRLRLDHPCLSEEAASIAGDGYVGTVHVAPSADDYRVVAGGHTVLALRYLVAFDHIVWDRRTQAYRPAAEVYREVDCLVEV